MILPSKTIVVVGSANVDLVTTLMRTPRPGETVLGQSFTTVMGGKGANQAVAAARLGAQVTFVGCVGKDGFGEMQRRALGAEGIALDCLRSHPEASTGTAVILVASRGESTIVVTPGANGELSPDDIAAADAAIARADALLVQMEIPPETVQAALEAAKRHNVLSVLDAGPAEHVTPELVELASLVSPNETEAETITGVGVGSIEGARAAAECLLDMGARETVIKLGARGAYYRAQDGSERYVPVFPVKAIDTTAAGDAFTAALTLAWQSVPPEAALRFASAAGALATTVHGAQPAMPSRAAVDALIG